jgi:uncharacterized membrane protein YphA (DoxX/SURF4 family)
MLRALFDRLVFRPLMGWATAWSFDRLRLWLEEGLDPIRAARQALVHGIARVSLALVFVYHGLVPKLLGPHPDEIVILRDSGLSAAGTGIAIIVVGIAELLFALCLALFWRRRWPLILCLALMLVATIGVAITSPKYLSAAFNPVSLNLAVASLAVIDLLVLSGVPTAANCRRHPSLEAK